VVFAGIATANVSAAAMITPQRIPHKKVRLALVPEPCTSVSISATPLCLYLSIAARSSRKCSEKREPSARFWPACGRRNQLTATFLSFFRLGCGVSALGLFVVRNRSARLSLFIFSVRSVKTETDEEQVTDCLLRSHCRVGDCASFCRK
jgi:hypothetical protein